MNRFLPMILILIHLLIFAACALEKTETKTPVANNGILDLREWDVSSDGPIQLNGEWDFYWKQLLISQPKTDSDILLKTKQIHVPKNWNAFLVDGKKVGGSGYATYRLKILTGIKNKPIAFKLLTFSSAYNFYVNKKKLASAGITGTEKSSTKPSYKPQECLYIPGNSYEELDLILEVSNFHESNGGLWNTIHMGLEKDIRNLREKNLVFDFFLFSCILTMGLYHLGLFSLRPDDNSTIFFTGLCFLISLRILVTHDERYLTVMIPHINWFLLHKLGYLTYSLSVTFAFAFIYSLFPKEVSKKYTQFIIISSLAYSLIILMTAPVFYGSILFIFQIMTIFFLLYAARCMVFAVIQKRIGAKAISIGFFILFITVINDILYQNQMINSEFISSIGIFVLLVSQAFVLSSRFSNAFSTIESLEEKYRNIFENAIEGIYQYSINGEIINANPALAKILGYASPQHLIKSVSGNERQLFLKPGQIDKISDELFKNEELLNFETQLYKLDGSIIWTLGNAKAVKSSGGEITHIEGMILDITERKQVEVEINKAKEAAEATNEIKSQFLANMSHEIRTPLTGVIGMTDLLNSTRLTQEQQEYTATIKSSSGLLLTIVNDILDFSKIEAGQLELEEINFDLRILLDEVYSILSVHALEKKLVFDCEISVDTPVFYNGDPDRIKQILINITSNAIKFTRQGSVAISVKPESENDSSATLLFTVQDTGIGIPENKIDKLFIMFSQADITMSRKYGGTGLGLAISKELVELMGGKIGVTSTEGKGSVFHFRVILKKQSRESLILKTKNSNSSIPTINLTDKSGLRILVVEDNPVNQVYTTKLLSKMGYSADVAANGQIAIERLSHEAYDLVLMDIQMPVMDGFEATRILRDHSSTVIRHDIPVIAMTAHAMKEDREKCIRVGMNDYVTKPFKPLKLAEVIEHYLIKSDNLHES